MIPIGRNIWKTIFTVRSATMNIATRTVTYYLLLIKNEKRCEKFIFLCSLSGRAQAVAQIWVVLDPTEGD